MLGKSVCFFKAWISHTNYVTGANQWIFLHPDIICKIKMIKVAAYLIRFWGISEYNTCEALQHIPGHRVITDKW